MTTEQGNLGEALERAGAFNLKAITNEMSILNRVICRLHTGQYQDQQEIEVEIEKASVTLHGLIDEHIERVKSLVKGN